MFIFRIFVTVREGKGKAKRCSMSSDAAMIDDSPVLQDLRQHLTGSGAEGQGSSSSSASAASPTEHRTAVALPVAAIKSLLGVIQRSKAHHHDGIAGGTAGCHRGDDDVCDGESRQPAAFGRTQSHRAGVRLRVVHEVSVLW